MPRAQRSLDQLPLLEETWLIGISHLHAWVKEKDGIPRRPFLILIASSDTGLLRGSNLVPEPPTTEQVANVLISAMKHPPRGLGKACRPRTIAVTDAALVEPLQALLKDLGLEINVSVTEFSDEFYEVIRELENRLRGSQSEIPAMLDTPEVTPGLLRGVYEAAAEFYRAAPWVQLSNDQVLAIRRPGERDYRYALVMGQGGVEYGLILYTDWSEVKHQLMDGDDPMSGWPAGGWHSLFYDTADNLPFADLDAIEQHGFDIAAEDAYPVVVVIEEHDQVRRPTREEWEWYEAALRVIPVTVRDHLLSNSRGDYESVEKNISVKTQHGMMNVDVKYPAGEQSLGDLPVEWLEPGSESNDLPAFDLRSMEGMMSKFSDDLGAQVEHRDPALVRSQEIMYRAWEETNPAKRIVLAHEALRLSKQCADAYVLLAEEEADTLNRALELYRQGMEAGARALGAKYFKENSGYFWGLLETRPYMRAREGLAETLWRLKRYEEAVNHYRELLLLNPEDNQGNRYSLLNLLMQIERNKDALALLDQYRDEWSAVWLYSRALLEFQMHGPSPDPEKILQDALEENPYVPAYLTREKRVPSRHEDYYGWGDESEAVYYASEYLNYWRRIPGAIEWLRTEIKVRPPRKRSSARSVSGRSRNRGGH